MNQHFELIEKLARAREMLQSLRDAACPGAAALTGMPHTPGVKDKVGDLAAEIVDMDARVGFLEEEVKASEEQIMPFIQGIDDDQTRLIFRLRFLRGLAWKEVAQVLGRYYTGKSVSDTCYKYLRDIEQSGD